ncbi:hypothetical protein AK88_03023 [Plasmodium fragile]|uniref:Uncharacterized protein n=1 Tax=Plasmodium fragile TaxID=5857 RepID=A0A0D9QK57_PLAFR|nr:uncharacterized protein AK88_03023 [Plasmodium fragile]KJP87343.1 hypothetical protein AK88_03023 [Plasmodium fragile]
MQIGCRGASAGARQALRIHRQKQKPGAINEYREKLQALSKHEKVVRIDLNGKEKKTCKYFFDKDKYVYVKSRAQIERFDRGAGRPIGEASAKPVATSLQSSPNTAHAATVSTTAAIPTAMERKVRKDEKALRDTYDLSQEEMLYMKFVQKIKMKNMYSLLNNIRKNKYISKKQRDVILSCIYKYLSHNCYLMSKKEFFFFLYIFPQQLKYASKTVHYLKSLLDKDQMTLTQCLRLVSEINLYHVNYHLRGHYVRFLIRNAHKITLPQIMNLLSKGSYLFAITPDFKSEEQLLDDVLKKKLINIVKDTQKVPLDGDIKWDYLNYMEWCAGRNNIYLNLFLNDLSLHLHRKIFFNNVEVLKQNQDYEYLQRILTLGRYNLCINHLNILALSRDGDSFLTRGKTTKVKVFPSYITEQGRGRTKWGGVRGGEPQEEHQVGEQAGRDGQVKQPSNHAHVDAPPPHDHPVATNELVSTAAQESNTLKEMKMAFSFSTPFEKLKNNQYDHLKHLYHINTKVSDKNVKVLLKFFRMLYHHNSSSSHVENLLCRNNLSKIVSDLRKAWGKNTPMGRGHMCKTYYGEDSPLWRLTRWWTSNHVMSTPDKQVPFLHNLFEHIHGETPRRRELPVQEKPLLSCKNAQLEQQTVLLPYEEIKGAMKKDNHEDNPSNVCHLSTNSPPAENHSLPFQAKDAISRIVNNVYFNAQYNKKYFHKSQLNCLAKSLLYISHSFVEYVQMGGDLSREEVDPRRKKNKLLNQVEKTFYEIFTYVMKNMYLIKLSNWFHIFVAIQKFGGAPWGRGEATGPTSKTGEPSEEDTLPLDRMQNLLQIVHTVRAYRYQEVRAIVQDRDTRRALQIDESPIRDNELPGGDTTNYDTLHKIILSKFRIHDKGVITKDKEPPLVTQGTHNVVKTTETPSPSAVKYTYETDSTLPAITLQCGANYLLTMLSNYLDGTPFQTKRFLIILYHLNRSRLKGASVQAHLETTLQKDHERFRNRYFYMHTGCGGNKPLLNKSLVAKVRAAYLTLKGGRSPTSKRVASCPGSPGWRTFPVHPNSDNHTHDVYTQMEKLLIRNKHDFTLDDMITFIATYSLNGLYHSTVYFSISKWLLQHDIASLPDEMKIFLLILFGQCTHVYKPLYFHLLHLVSQIEVIKEETALPLLCSLIHMLIHYDRHTRKVKLKHVRYVERKFGKIHWPYFFPIELFLWRSAHEMASRRIRTLERDSISDKWKGREGNGTRANRTCEKINSTQLILNLEFDLLKLKNYLKDILPQMVLQLEKRSVGGEDHLVNTTHGVMSPPPPADLYPLNEEATRQQVLQNCKNFLSYHFVKKNFLVSRRSLYYEILVQLFKKVEQQ